MNFVTINGTLSSGEEFSLENCIDFSFEKDRYSATQTFTGKFIIEFNPKQYKTVNVNICGHTVLKGFVDKQILTRDAGKSVLTLTAKAFSSSLDSNHIKPGFYSGLSFSSAFSSFAQGLNGVSCSSGTTALSSITYTDWTTIYNALAHISLRAHKFYPYVTMGNELRCRLPASASSYSITSSEIIDVSDKWDTSKLISRIYMKDTEDNYAAYYADDPYTKSLGIVRVKHIAPMKDWLFDIAAGLKHKLYMARRRCHIRSITYKGYKGEDLYSVINFPLGYFNTITSLDIHAISIKGDNKTISTTLKYFDDYYSVLKG